MCTLQEMNNKQDIWMSWEHYASTSCAALTNISLLWQACSELYSKISTEDVTSTPYNIQTILRGHGILHCLLV